MGFKTRQAGSVSDESSFSFAGRLFRVVTSDFAAHQTTDQHIVVLKSLNLLQSYDDLFAQAPAKNAVEFGIFEGGSLIYFALAHPDFAFVGIDSRDPSDAVLRHIADLGLSERVKLYYNTSQSDRDAINRIMATAFDDTPLGLVIDDASHMYALSRRTFELTFGRLAPNGVYCLEDWAWAHWPEPYQTQRWSDQPALTNLVFEIVALYPSTGDLIAGIEVSSNVVRVRRGTKSFKEFTIDRHLRMRSRPLSLI